MKYICSFLLSAALLSFAALGRSQLQGAAQAPAPDYRSLMQRTLAGDYGPLLIRYNELPEDLKAVDLSLTGFGDLAEEYGGPYGAASVDLRGRSVDAIQRVLAYLGTYWTTGKNVDWRGAEYIVAYRVDLPKGSRGYDPMSPAVPANPLALQTLRLRMIRADQVVSITPRPDLTKPGWLHLVDEMSNPKTGGDGNRAQALSNIKQVGLAALMYTNDYDDDLPNAHSASQAKKVLMPYIRNAEMFISQNPNGGQLLYNVNLAAVNSTAIPNPASMPLFYDSRPWPDGTRPVVYLDGHAMVVNADGWAAVAAELARKFKHKPAAPPPKAGGKPKVHKKK